MRRLLLDLDSYGSTDPLGIFPRVLKRTADVPAHRLAVVFRLPLRLGRFPVCHGEWLNVTRNSKGSTSLLNGQLQTNFLNTSLLSKVYERQFSVRLRLFMECRGVLPTTQLSYRKGLCTFDALLCVSHTLRLTECVGDRVGG